MRRTAVAFVLLFLLAGWATAEGMISASVSIRASRSVYDSVIRSGEDVDMSVNIDGFVPVVCQWYFEDQPLPGENLQTMHIDSAEVTDTGVYRMDAIDENGKIRVSVDVALRVVDNSIPKTGDARIPAAAIGGAMIAAGATAALLMREKYRHIT